MNKVRLIEAVKATHMARCPERRSLSSYISDLRNSLKRPGARAFYFPANKAKRKRMNKRLGREIGFGLKDYPEKDVKRVLGTLYGKLIVANSMDQTGVQINNSEFIAAIKSRM